MIFGKEKRTILFLFFILAAIFLGAGLLAVGGRQRPEIRAESGVDDETGCNLILKTDECGYSVGLPMCAYDPLYCENLPLYHPDPNEQTVIYKYLYKGEEDLNTGLKHAESYNVRCSTKEEFWRWCKANMRLWFPTCSEYMGPFLTSCPSLACPLSMAQEVGVVKFSLNSVWQYVTFVAKGTGLVDKLAVKAGNYGGAERRITCKVTMGDGRDLSAALSSASFTNTSGASWRIINFKNNKFQLTKGQPYRLYCKGPDWWNSLYWIWDAALGLTEGKTYRIYLCPTLRGIGNKRGQYQSLDKPTSYFFIVNPS